MKIFYLFLTFILLITITSCYNQPTEMQISIRKFQHDYILKKYEENGFICVGKGTGSKEGVLNQLFFDFMIKDALDIEQARKILVENVLDLIDTVNLNKELEKYFSEWPIEIQNIEFTLTIDRGDGLMPKFANSTTNENKISFVYITQNNIHYMISRPNNQPPIEIHSESIKEAMDTLKSQGWTDPIN